MKYANFFLQILQFNFPDTHQMKIFMLFLFSSLWFISQQQPDKGNAFTLFDTINLTAASSLGQKMTRDGKLLFVSTVDFNVQIFQKDDLSFTHLQTLQEPIDIVEDIECTPDREWLAIGCWDRNVYIYKRAGRKYDLYQTLKSDEDVRVYAVNFSEDHALLIIGTQVRVVIFTFNGTQYVHSQYIVEPEQKIYEVILTKDKSQLIVGDYSKSMYIYELSGSEYVLGGTLDFVEEDYRLASLSDDEQTLVVGSLFSKQITVFKPQGKSYEKVQSFTVQHEVWQPCLSGDGAWLFVTTQGQALLYHSLAGAYHFDRGFKNNEGQALYWHYAHSGHDGQQTVVIADDKIYVYSTESFCDTNQFITLGQCGGQIIVTRVFIFLAILIGMAICKLFLFILGYIKRNKSEHEEVHIILSKEQKVGQTPVNGEEI